MISFPRSFRRVVAATFILIASISFAADHARVTLLVTTDLHGRIYPLDYYTNKPVDLGLAKLATLIKEARRETPDLLLVDCGDTIQGTPLVYLHNRKNNTPTDPMMVVMNALGYVSMTPGNHEYNFGRAVLEKARKEAKFPFLSANTYRAGTDELAYSAYVVKEVDGVRVGILGLTTPAIPHWENPENYAGLEFRPLVSEAKKWTQILREKEHVDVVIVTAHFGLEEEPGTGKKPAGDFEGENAALALAREVPGIDAIFLGHTHRDIPTMEVNGVLLAQAGRWGYKMVRADLELSKENGAWKVTAKNSKLIPVQCETAADPEILALAEPYQRETQDWLSRKIGHSAKELDLSAGPLRDSALLDLVQRAQMEACRADVSLAATFNPRARIPAGDVTVRDIAGLYTYENTLVVVEVTGAQLKAVLEHSARYFLPYEPGKSPADLVNRDVAPYNFDIAEGVSYEIDIRRPVGDRIQNLMFNGKPLAPDHKLRLATNNYRYNGGGGYVMLREGRVLLRSSAEIRDIIIDWVEKHREIPTEASNNWRILP
ncbi:MAG: bifunctional UDP-sugar hydrolase/5'-nucleotidase [Nibricoccus sp.]